MAESQGRYGTIVICRSFALEEPKGDVMGALVHKFIAMLVAGAMFILFFAAMSLIEQFRRFFVELVDAECLRRQDGDFPGGVGYKLSCFDPVQGVEAEKWLTTIIDLSMS